MALAARASRSKRVARSASLLISWRKVLNRHAAVKRNVQPLVHDSHGASAISRMILYLPSSAWPMVRPAAGWGVPISLPVTGQRLASGGWLSPQYVQATAAEYRSL